MQYRSSFKLFSEKDLDVMLQNKIQSMEAEVSNKADDYLLNVNEVTFVDYLAKKYFVDSIELKFDALFVSTYEKEIFAEDFPGHRFHVRQRQRYKKDVVRYHIPFDGNQELLYYQPNQRIVWTLEVSIEEHCLCFDVINFYDDPKQIKRESDGNIDCIRRQSAYVINQINLYNSSLTSKAEQFLQSRKQHLLKKNDLLASLGVPIKRRDFPQTFAVPTPQTNKKIRVSQPIVKEAEYRPEPTLEASIYQDILQVVHDVGKQFERMPSTYTGKSEEDLRDHILLVLEPRFEGSATGETFNKTGKTDILLRYENSNIFIAECKFWSGIKGFLETISQVLGYLTWRDSKSAIIVFSQNKSFSPVINTVETEISRHPNFLGFVNKKEETWLNYRFHINDDVNREVKLAVLLFHIPRI